MNSMIKVSLLVLGVSLPMFVLGEDQIIERQTIEVIPDHLAYLYARDGAAAAGDAQYQLYAEKRRWENGRRLRVCFYSGNPVVVKLVKSIASEWNSYTGVTFDFGPEGGWLNCLSPQVGFPEIRIGFSERGYWSYVGSDSERYGGERAPSMNFDSFNRIYNEQKFTPDNVVQKSDSYHRATIRHEFGHALGLLHEHQNTAMNCYSEIRWSGTGNIYEVFGGPPNFWSKEQVDRNIGFVGATDPDYVSGEPDPKSIMMYSLQPAIFKSGSSSKCATSINYEISNKDKMIAEKLYPRQVESSAKLVVAEEISAAYVKLAPQFVANNEVSDYKNRIVADLESDDTATRRNARARLSSIMENGRDSVQLNDLIAALPNSSYRYKLGLAVALSHMDKKLGVSSSAEKILSQQASSERDVTLKSNLMSAKRKVEIR